MTACASGGPRPDGAPLERELILHLDRGLAGPGPTLHLAQTVAGAVHGRVRLPGRRPAALTAAQARAALAQLDSLAIGREPPPRLSGPTRVIALDGRELHTLPVTVCTDAGLIEVNLRTPSEVRRYQLSDCGQGPEEAARQHAVARLITSVAAQVPRR